MLLSPESSAPTPAGGLSRRRVLAAGVWGAPVIAVALAAPASALSGSQLQLEITSGDVAPGALSTAFEGVDLNEAGVPLILHVTTTNPVGPASGAVTATLAADAAGIAHWDPQANPSGQTALGLLDGNGEVELPLDAEGYGTFTVNVTVDGQSWQLTVTFTA